MHCITFASRDPKQYYVWWSREGPVSLRKLRGLRLNEYNNFFNLTMTYRYNMVKYYYFHSIGTNCSSMKLVHDVFLWNGSA